MWNACSVRRWCACVYSSQYVLFMQIFSKVHTNTQSQLPKVRRDLIGKVEYSLGGDRSRPQTRVTACEKFAYKPLCKVCIILENMQSPLWTDVVTHLPLSPRPCKLQYLHKADRIRWGDICRPSRLIDEEIPASGYLLVKKNPRLSVGGDLREIYSKSPPVTCITNYVILYRCRIQLSSGVEILTG